MVISFSVIKISVLMSNMLELNKIVLIFRFWLYIYINKKIVLFDILNCKFFEFMFVFIFWCNICSGGIENRCKSG